MLSLPPSVRILVARAPYNPQGHHNLVPIIEKAVLSVLAIDPGFRAFRLRKKCQAG
jgi:hypothetical protein